MLDRRSIPLFLTTFLLTSGYGFLYSLLAVIRDDFGLSETEIGVLGATGFIAGFCAQVSLSRYADRGHTRIMLMTGLAFAMLGNLGMVLATDLSGFLASRACLGLGAGTFAPAVRRLVILSDPERAGERLGLMASFDMAGFISGPVLASILYEAFGLQAAFGVLVILLGLLVVPVLRVPFDESPVEPTEMTETPSDGPIRLLLSRAPIRGVLLCTLAFYTTVGVFEAIWAVFLDDLGASQRFIGATLSIFSIPMLIFPAMAGRLAQRIGPLKVAAMSIGFAIPCMVLYGHLTGLYVLAALVLIHAVADAFTMPSLQVGIALASPREHLASGQGLIGAAGQLVAAATALGAGFLYDGWGAETLFTSSALLMVLLLAMGLSAGRQLMRPPAQPESS